MSLKIVYGKLEPLKFGRLECNDFEGVLLNRDDCILIVKQIVRMELELKQLHEDKGFYSEQWEKTQKEFQFYKTNYELNN